MSQCQNINVKPDLTPIIGGAENAITENARLVNPAPCNRGGKRRQENAGTTKYRKLNVT